MFIVTMDAALSYNSTYLCEKYFNINCSVTKGYLDCLELMHFLNTTQITNQTVVHNFTVIQNNTYNNTVNVVNVTTYNNFNYSEDVDLQNYYTRSDIDILLINMKKELIDRISEPTDIESMREKNRHEEEMAKINNEVKQPTIINNSVNINEIEKMIDAKVNNQNKFMAQPKESNFRLYVVLIGGLIAAGVYGYNSYRKSKLMKEIPNEQQNTRKDRYNSEGKMGQFL